MNMKKNGGFTLVELIIVIAILAILSSVAVAGYSSYITKANDSAATQVMQNVYQHAVLANAESGAVVGVKFDADNKTLYIELAAGNANFGKDFASGYGTSSVKSYTPDADNDYWTIVLNSELSALAKKSTDVGDTWPKGVKMTSATAQPNT